MYPHLVLDPRRYGGGASISGVKGAEPPYGFFSSTFLWQQRKVEINYYLHNISYTKFESML